MKPWLKWTASGLVLVLLGAGTVRTLTARKASQAALLAQQTAQKAEVSVVLTANDVVSVKHLTLPLTLPLAGPIRAVNSAFVKARVAGELQALTLREGDSVKAGQILARIDPTESNARLRQAQQQAQAARAQVDMAQRSFDNNRALVGQGFISSTALESSQATLAAAQATFAATQSATDLAAKALDDTWVRAPIAGQIAQRLAQPGERVAVEARILEIVDNRQLELEASLTAADALAVKVGQPALLNIDGVAAPISAKVARINPSATLGSRAVLVYLAIAPGSGLRQGLYVQGSLQTGSLQTLALPLSAVRTDQPQPYVQLLVKARVQMQPVVMGVRSEQDGQSLVAITGVAEGAQVIAGSVGSLRPGTPVTLAGPGAR